MDYRANLSSREIQVHLKSTSKLKETPSGDATITRLDKFKVKKRIKLQNGWSPTSTFQSLSITNSHYSGLCFDVECICCIYNIKDSVKVIVHNFLNLCLYFKSHSGKQSGQVQCIGNPFN